MIESAPKMQHAPRVTTMVATPAPASGTVNEGPRPLNLGKDVPAVTALLETVFRPALEVSSQRALRGSLSLSNQPNLLLRLNQVATGINPGFVWERNGRIVGNVTVLKTKTTGRYLIANVAVHPLERRRGIARALMETALDAIRAGNGDVVLLQVKNDNDAAQRLYLDLNFKIVGTVTSWYASYSGLTAIPTTPDDDLIRPLRNDEWHEALALDETVYPADLNWPEPLSRTAYKQGFRERLSRFISGRQEEHWGIDDGQTLIGLASLRNDVGRPYSLSIRVGPDYRPRLERPLLSKLLRRTRYLRRRYVRIDHLSEDEHMNMLLREANFQARRVLTTMRLVL